MKKTTLLRVITLAALLAGCGGNEPPSTPDVKNLTCEDLGKVTDNEQHAELLAKCPDYLPGGAKKSKKMEW